MSLVSKIYFIIVIVVHFILFFVFCVVFFFLLQIDWVSITQVNVGSSLGNYMEFNSSDACPTMKSCPKNCSHCWNNKHCQLFDNGSNSIHGKYQTFKNSSFALTSYKTLVTCTQIFNEIICPFFYYYTIDH